MRPATTPEVGGPSPLTESFPFDRLSRWPYPEAPELQAHDAADLLLLDTAHAWWSDAARGPAPGPVAVLEDRHGALALPLLGDPARTGLPPGTQVRVGQDAMAQERSLEANLARLRGDSVEDGDGGEGTDGPSLTRHALGPELVAGARTVLLVLPRSLDALAQWAHLVAEHAAEDVVLLAGGRDKHMTPRQNAVLARYFASVVPGRGRSKARVLTARSPRRGRPAPFPVTASVTLPGLTDLPGRSNGSGRSDRVLLAAHGATFGGPRVDPGTALLLEHLDLSTAAPTAASAAADGDRPRRAVDVGTGNGTIALWLALADPGLRVLATDQSADACASAALTAQLNGVADRVEVRRDDALASCPDASEDLLVLNPPFHAGSTVDRRVAVRLIGESARVLRPGAHLWCVWNSHLRHRPELERLVGPTRQVARNRTFTVTVSTRR